MMGGGKQKGCEIQMHSELWSKCVGTTGRGPESSFWGMFCIPWTLSLLLLRVRLPLSSCLLCYLSLSLFFHHLGWCSVLGSLFRLFERHLMPRGAAKNACLCLPLFSCLILPLSDYTANTKGLWLTWHIKCCFCTLSLQTMLWTSF